VARLADGTFQVFSSDHAPYRFDETGKLANGPDAPFDRIANGVPGLEVRMPLLFSEGVLKGRIDIHRFVELTSTRAAKIYGMFPQKGSISIGADADLVIWDQDREVTIERIPATTWATRRTRAQGQAGPRRSAGQRVVVDGGEPVGGKRGVRREKAFWGAFRAQCRGATPRPASSTLRADTRSARRAIQGGRRARLCCFSRRCPERPGQTSGP
jgi:dihydropyrimidinase